MILYTMMPQELIFPYETDSLANQQTVSYQGVPLLVEAVDGQHAQVIRVLSSDPQHFLNEQICPGTKISFANLNGYQEI
ncbi:MULTISPECIES: YlzJ-like family protein [Bacillaceae]|uniref:YlzJ-like family protein n=1 Tax=Bacillaceae TaxID=186817 RepID=UPI000830EA62|nr:MULTISPECIES: YlzJ-like family protein [Bacillaceae]MCM3765708.1 YlzJ-like family protein [Neobacillus niacini]